VDRRTGGYFVSPKEEEMKLQELVSRALVDLVTGVKEAQDKLKDVGGVVVPPDGYSASAESLNVHVRALVAS
jgi:hypothetical protein